jgi:hypothetical protein
LSNKRIKVVYYVTSNVSRLPYGFGPFSEQRNSRNSDRDIGIEEIASVICKFSSLNKTGKIPLKVKKMISESEQLEWNMNYKTKKRLRRNSESSEISKEDNSNDDSESD